MPLKVLIVGAGLAGLATAIGFVRHGHHVIVVERGSSRREETGAGILLGPNALRVLSRWGLELELKDYAHVTGAVKFRSGTRGEVVRKVVKRSKAGTPSNWYMTRSDLWKVFYDAAVKRGVEVSFARPVTAVEDEEGNRPIVAFEDGAKMEADLVIGADGTLSNTSNMIYSPLMTPGIQSKIRYSLFPYSNPRVCPDLTFQVAIPLSVMDEQPATKHLHDDPSVQIWMAPGRHIVASPAPKQGIYDAHFTDHEYGFESDGSVGTWNERIDDMAWIRDRFKDHDPAVRAMLKGAESCWKWRLAEAARLPSWTSTGGRVVLVGDSCHAMLPFAGQVRFEPKLQSPMGLLLIY